MNKTVIIQGSARPKGDTNTVINYMITKGDFDVIDLYSKHIKHYDYEYKNTDDDFLDVITNIIKNYDTIVFATPVYWYSMSGHLKVFFDRMSDLLRVHKELGRQLRGKKMAMLSSSNSNDLIEGFRTPFIESSKYLGMNYVGDIHTWVENDHINDDVKLIINNFIGKLK